MRHVAGYHVNQEHLLQKCEVYHGKKDWSNWIQQPETPDIFYTHCPYIKTLEPYIYEPSAKPRIYILSVNRAALILRHPFDSALSEFKRYVFVM
mgnify:CR=1 FL=1